MSYSASARTRAAVRLVTKRAKLKAKPPPKKTAAHHATAHAAGRLKTTHRGHIH